MRLTVFCLLSAILCTGCVGNTTTQTENNQEQLYTLALEELLDEIQQRIDVNRIVQSNETISESNNNTWTNPLLENDVATLLRQIQNDVPGILEVFATDASGHNIAQTNITSDLFQADEDWWQETFNNGKGESWYGALEYDESAQANCIPLYLAIRNDDGDVVAIIKVLIHTTAIEDRIWHYTQKKNDA